MHTERDYDLVASGDDMGPKSDNEQEGLDEANHDEGEADAVADDDSLEEEYVSEGLEIKPGQAKVIFPAEGGPWDIYHLGQQTYVSSGYASKNSWMLLEPKPLGVGPEATVHPPKVVRKAGRPRRRRLAKAAGPLAKPIRKGKSKGKGRK